MLSASTGFRRQHYKTRGNWAMKSVLMVDDDNTTLLGIGVRLKGTGYTVFTAKDAVSADATQLADAIENALSPGDSWQPRTNSS
jgi:hypothetical protein